MLGFVIGLACLWGLVRVWRGRRGCAPWGFDWGPPRRPSSHDRARHFMLRRLFEELDTTPGQEREIRAAVDDVTAAAGNLKDRLFDSRADLGKAFGTEAFDEETMAELLTRHDEPLDELRRAVVGGLARVHAALDPEQRQRLAHWLQRTRRWGGPYRSPA